MREPTEEERRLYCKPKQLMSTKRSVGSTTSITSNSSSNTNNSKQSVNKTNFSKYKTKEKGVVIKVKKNEKIEVNGDKECPFKKEECKNNNLNFESTNHSANNANRKSGLPSNIAQLKLNAQKKNNGDIKIEIFTKELKDDETKEDDLSQYEQVYADLEPLI